MIYKQGYMPEIETLLQNKTFVLPTKTLFWLNGCKKWLTNRIIFRK